ncbi:MAG: hypothetical protein NWE88_13135 [Candidatus Bathyarchaeota archaeon]|nr:hypothetical protein [Candidatus Bathyarchaeota archaeon]
MRARVATTWRPTVNLRLRLLIFFYSRLFSELDMERCEFGKMHTLSLEIM